MTCPELRIADAEIAALHPMGPCPTCNGASYPHGRCTYCGGWGWDLFASVNLPRGASARIGAAIVERLPHLRHAVWPPTRAAGGREALAVALAMIGGAA